MINFEFNRIKNILPLIKKSFDYFVWVMFFIFLLIGGIIYVTDRTYPGDKLYPFKLKFEGFVLATSKILNKQVDFSIDLVSRRSNEVAKILSSKKETKETLKRLDTQVEVTAISISQINNPVEKKEAAKKYIVRLSKTSVILSEKQNEMTTPPVNQPSTPESMSEDINNSQQTVNQTIDDMNRIVNQSETQDVTPTPTITDIPAPTDTPQPIIHKKDIKKENDKNESFLLDTSTPTDTPIPSNQPPSPTQENTPIPTQVTQPTIDNSIIPTDVPVNP